MPGDPKIRASDADRDRAAVLLREHHAAGRLDAAEFHERLDRALEAKTLGELDELMADLPAIDLYELPDAALRRQRRHGGHSGNSGHSGHSSPGGGGTGLPWGGAMMARDQSGGLAPYPERLAPYRVRLATYRDAGGALSAGATALVAWAAVALTLVMIAFVTGVLAGGLSAWWAFAAIPAGAISLIWFVIRRSQR